ncbi:MAG: hypothetical protein GX829_11380 [Clostridium sp.]|nr:hypothetical protein [Clostridium sp.]
MEILSTGEKIRKARIKKSMTLKELCGKEISVSKMSTIENDKVQAEDWILDLVSKRLGISTESLKKDMVEEIEDELAKLSLEPYSKGYVRELRSLIEVTEENNLPTQTFNARIQLINHYIEKHKIDKLNVEISYLYRTFINVVNQETMYLYFLTMSKYLFATDEYKNALVFLHYLMSNYYVLPDYISKEKRLEIPLMTVQCYVYLKEFEEARKLEPYLEELLTITKDNATKGQIHFLYYMLEPDNAKEEYEKMTESLKDEPQLHARAKYNIAMKALEDGNNEVAFEEMEKASKIYPVDELSTSVELVLKAMGEFVDRGHFEEASKYIDLVVNSAIENQDNSAVEKAYYFKGILLAESGSYDMAETYLSVSLDMLIKKGKTKDLAKRYNDMAHVYYKMDKKEDAIRYLALGLNSKGYI